MPKAIRIHQTGGPEVLQWQDLMPPAPGASDIQLRHTAVGINYIDIYHRSGVYPFALPATPGLEGVGEVTAVGSAVTGFAPGDKVAYAGGAPGAYSQVRNIAAARVVAVPAGLPDRQVASALFSGLTAQFLARRTRPIKAGDVVLIHAAAGGVGLLLTQWAKHCGATVIGTVGSEAKARLARTRGCDHTILYREADFAEAVACITEGRKVDVVYDSVGLDTLMKSIDCLRPLGMLVSYGVASGDTPLLDLRLLMAKGSLYVTRPSFGHYMGDESIYRGAAAELFELLGSGVLKTEAPMEWPLEQAADAHRAIESRATSGASILIP
jgi:NADPH2:quinone reductase